jgi:energy-coupling factor transporter ATP-binding protein EcfA2
VRENVELAASVAGGARPGGTDARAGPGRLAGWRVAGRRAAHRPGPPGRAGAGAGHRAPGAAARRAGVGPGRGRDRGVPPGAADRGGRGLAVVLVEHDVRLVMRTCATVHVLDFGRVLAAGRRAEIQARPAVLDAYLGAGPGRPMTPPPSRSSSCGACGRPTARSRCSTASTCPAAGARCWRVLGPNGAGKTTLLNVLAGLHPLSGGDVSWPGGGSTARPADPLGPGRAVPHPRGPRHLPQPHRAREPAHGGGAPPAHPPRSRPTPTSASPGWRAARASWPARCRAASSRCWRWPRAWPPTRPCWCSTSCRWAWRPLVVEELYAQVAGWPARRVGPGGRAVRPGRPRRRRPGRHLAHGRVAAVGAPHEIESQLSAAYLGG